MKDAEDIFKSVIEYLMEELPIQGGGTISRLNYYINAKNVEKGDTLLEDVPNDASRFILNQRIRDAKGFKNWIDIAVDTDVDLDSNFDTVAKTFIISVNSLLQDDFSDNIFYSSVRMAEVIKDAMVDYFKQYKVPGFMFGELTTNALPDRVSVKGTNALMSGVIYQMIIQ